MARCPSLDIASQAETQDEALRSLQEAVEGWFEVCLEQGILREALGECGFVLASGNTAGSEFEVRESSPLERPIQVKMPAYIAYELLNQNHAAS